MSGHPDGEDLTNFKAGFVGHGVGIGWCTKNVGNFDPFNIALYWDTICQDESHLAIER